MPRSPAARKRATRADIGLFSSLSRHQMLCLNEHKIMLERHFCQAFYVFFYRVIFNQQSITYKRFASKYFKNRAKKMALSLNFLATRYSGTQEDRILPEDMRKNRCFYGKRPLEKRNGDPRYAFSDSLLTGENHVNCSF